ncbi:hypothetical protein CCACVL1_09876 [Corchorus capsularis]|uniref:Uncharacterized protein n=1 Tax=Corchorus capsularis TaxID=210143 RepID=A0A1R3ITT4_COCAP|nr:hypothetical protein CCACVL1_09876 [Corchorus capsularis]
MGSHEKSQESSSNNHPNPSVFMNISILVVDDDATSLAIVSAMLREWRYEVATAQSPIEALSILRARPGHFDLVVTDLHMPEMNGIELQQQINRESPDIPVIIMSSDDQESVMLHSLACGAVFYIVKPVNPEDLKNVWQYAIAARKGKQVVVEDVGSIQFEQGESSSSAGKKSTRRPRRSLPPGNGTDHHDKNKDKEKDKDKRGAKRKAPRNNDDDDDDDDETGSAPKKAKVIWTNTLHNQFLDALRRIGMDKAVPKKILEHMNTPGITRENVASHLQKYRMFLKRVAERTNYSSKAFVERVLRSSFAAGHPTLLQAAEEYARLEELQRLRGLTFHPGYGGTALSPHHRNANAANNGSMLFGNQNNIASSSNSSRHQHGYGQSRLLGRQATTNNRRSVSGNSQGNRVGYANGSNISSLNGGNFSGNGLMNGANPMQSYQNQFQSFPNYYNDAGASSSVFRFGANNNYSSNPNMQGTGNFGTFTFGATPYPTLNTGSTPNNNNGYVGFNGMGQSQTLFGNGGYSSMNGPFNYGNVNVAAMGNQTFNPMAQGSGSSSFGSYGSNQASPTYAAANQQTNTSMFPSLANNGGASLYNSVNLMNNNGGPSQYQNSVQQMNNASSSSFDNIIGDGYLSDLLLESRNNQLQQTGENGVQNPELSSSSTFPDIYPTLEDLLNIEFLESLSLEETSPRTRRNQTTSAQARQQSEVEQLADSDLSNLFQMNNASSSGYAPAAASGSASGNDPLNNQACLPSVKIGETSISSIPCSALTAQVHDLQALQFEPQSDGLNNFLQEQYYLDNVAVADLDFSNQGKMRPIFCGNFEYDARQSDLERLFRKYGKVERVDMKSGFAFIYMEDERDADDAIRALDRTEFGRKGRRLRVEWTKHERGIRRPGGSGGGGGGSSGGGGGSRRSSTNSRPSKTLFVINFDPYSTRTRDLERHFESYGKIVSVRIRRNFAFVQYDSQDDATRALEATNMSKLMDRVISVEYAVRDDDDRRNGYSPERGRDRSPERGRDRRRSPSPYRRERGSPDYGRGSSRSPYNRKERASPDYGRGRSPSPYKRRDRASPEYGRPTSRSRSPHRRDRAGTDNARGSSRSPYRKDKASPENGRGPSRSPYRREKCSAENDRSPSQSPYKRERPSSDNGRGPSHSPYGRDRASPENGRGTSPGPVPDGRDSPYGGGAESPVNERYGSQSPAGEE